MKVLDLFSGIGGFSYGLELASPEFETVAFCEFDPKARLVLKKHWPDVPCYKDVKELTYDRLKEDGIITHSGGLRRDAGRTEQPLQGAGSPSQARGKGQTNEERTGSSIDLICGGFPCQPFSQAGKQGGFEDDRDLWPEYFRLIQEVRPTWVIGENVAGFIGMGLERTISDLEREGYGIQTFVIPACSVGAPHQRNRIWIIAHSERRGGGMHAGTLAGEKGEIQAGGKQFQPGPEAGNRGTGPGNVADSKESRSLRGGDWDDRNDQREIFESEQDNRDEVRGRVECGGSNADATEPGLQDGRRASMGQSGQKPEPERFCGQGRNVPDADPAGLQERRGAEPVQTEHLATEHISEGTGQHWAVESDVGRVAHGVPGRVDRLKQLGNAVVPQVVEMIGRAIMKAKKSQEIQNG